MTLPNNPRLLQQGRSAWQERQLWDGTRELRRSALDCEEQIGALAAEQTVELAAGVQ